MAALFALGAMSLAWMLLIGALIAAEKLLPWRTASTAGVSVVLAALAIGIAASPSNVPALTVPGSPAAMRAMGAMGMHRAMGRTGRWDAPKAMGMHPKAMGMHPKAMGVQPNAMGMHRPMKGSGSGAHVELDAVIDGVRVGLTSHSRAAEARGPGRPRLGPAPRPPRESTTASAPPGWGNV